MIILLLFVLVETGTSFTCSMKMLPYIEAFKKDIWLFLLQIGNHLFEFNFNRMAIL